ncbi:MAG: alpha/beta fold hydrolase [Chitinophagaceae bacterium]|nr:alpha/beta fold hydrolase [Chitinophagaceae bacterium]
MKVVYCMCGLGSDERIFSKLEWSDHTEVHYLKWLIPEKNENLSHYAGRMTTQIRHPEPVLIGVSFGGMMSLEITKLLSVDKLILISSIRNSREVPGWMRFSGKLKLDYLIPKGKLHDLRPLKLFSPVENYFLGAATPEEKQLAHEYREKVNPDYLKWSIHHILNWQNNWQPPAVYHLHGANDKIFPVTNLSPTHIIQNAGHFMVFQRAAEVSKILKEII